jgi:hypothetical protein
MRKRWNRKRSNERGDENKDSKKKRRILPDALSLRGLILSRVSD